MANRIIYSETRNYVGSASSGVFSTTNTAWTDVTNLSVTITTIESRPIILTIIPDGSSNLSRLGGAAGVPADLGFRFVYGTDIEIANYELTSSSSSMYVPSSVLKHIDIRVAGTYTYKLQAKNISGSGSIVYVYYAKLFAFEL